MSESERTEGDVRLLETEVIRALKYVRYVVELIVVH